MLYVSMSNKLRPEKIIEYLKALLPEIDDVLRQMEKDGGWLRLSPKVVQYLTALKITNYPEYYSDEKKILTLFAIAMAGEGEEVREFVREIGKAYEERNRSIRLHLRWNISSIRCFSVQAVSGHKSTFRGCLHCHVTPNTWGPCLA
jgi:phytoene dehydrogenase-like protein